MKNSRSFAIEPLPPFRLDLTAWALRRRADNAVDVWDGETYRRVLVLRGAPVEVSVVEKGTPDAPRLAVTLSGERVDARTQEPARAALSRLLGLELRLDDFYRLAAGDPLLADLAERFRGVKPPRLPSLHECLVNAIACQQLTLTVGIRLLNRLAEAYGEAGGPRGLRAFPTAERLAGLEPETLRPLGFSGAKARSIVAVSGAVARGELVPAAVEALPDDAAVAELLRLRGVGRWSAEYALLRGFGRLHVFPGDDVGARNNLARRLEIPGPLDYAAVAEAVRPWQPYAGLVYFHLLLANLAERGHVAGEGRSGRRPRIAPAEASSPVDGG